MIRIVYATALFGYRPIGLHGHRTIELKKIKVRRETEIWSHAERSYANRHMMIWRKPHGSSSSGVIGRIAALASEVGNAARSVCLSVCLSVCMSVGRNRVLFKTAHHDQDAVTAVGPRNYVLDVVCIPHGKRNFGRDNVPANYKV